VLVWVVIVIPKFNIWVSLACHLCSFLRTVFLGGLEVEAGLYIYKELGRHYHYGFDSGHWHIRVRLLESGVEQIRPRSSSFPPSHHGNNSY
jgi:hypothetical protein